MNAVARHCMFEHTTRRVVIEEVSVVLAVQLHYLFKMDAIAGWAVQFEPDGIAGVPVPVHAVQRRGVAEAAPITGVAAKIAVVAIEPEFVRPIVVDDTDRDFPEGSPRLTARVRND